MALLPCLRWDDARWWLPLRSETAEVLAAVMTSAWKSGNGESAALLNDLLRRDSALLTFVTLRWLAANESRAAKKVRINRLAKWFRPRVVRIFAEGDAFLGQPAISPEIVERWCELYELDQRHQAFELSRFPAIATGWLRAAGPPVPRQWRASWPRPLPAKIGATTSCSERFPGGEASSVDTADSPNVATSETQPHRNGAPLRLASLALPHLARQVQRQRALEERFAEQLHLEKLASLKQFAYGLSHEINNPLANIVTRTQQLQRDESDEQRIASMERVVGQAMRAHEMISDVMFFAHPPEPNRQRVCLTTIVNRAMETFRARCEQASIELAAELTRADSTEVWADPSMLHDAVAALLRNAIEAIGCEGAVRIGISRLGKRRPKAMIEVADSGPGVSDEALRHAFDPYYSGREAGRGLGLGLCRAYRVAKQHGGDIKLSSGPGGCVAQLSIRVDGQRNELRPNREPPV